MSEFLKYIIALFSKFSPIHQIFLVVFVGGLLFLGISFVKNAAFRKELLNMVAKLFKFSFNRTDLSKHELFFRAAIYKRLIKSVSFKGEVKTTLFHILLDEKTISVIDITKDWLFSLKGSISNELLIEYMFENIDNIIKDYESRIKRAYIELLGEKKGKKAFCLIYSRKEHGFKVVHDENVRFITSSIMKICNSKAFTQKQKIYHYLTLLELAVEISITDCELMFEKLNGDVNRLMQEND